MHAAQQSRGWHIARLASTGTLCPASVLSPPNSFCSGHQAADWRDVVRHYAGGLLADRALVAAAFGRRVGQGRTPRCRAGTDAAVPRNPNGKKPYAAALSIRPRSTHLFRARLPRSPGTRSMRRRVAVCHPLLQQPAGQEAGVFEKTYSSLISKELYRLNTEWSITGMLRERNMLIVGENGNA